MEEKRIFEGKTTNEAIEKGLKELKLTKKDVEIKVLEEDKRSFFDILAPRVVKVEITPKTKIIENKDTRNESEKVEKIISKEELEKAKENIKEFLEKFFKENNIKESKYEIKDDEKNTIIVNIEGNDANFLIGYRGEVLNAMQTFLIVVAGKDTKEKVHVNIDILGYREKRKKILEDLAIKVANNVIKGKKSITLDPMTAYERKIIHTKLQENNKVKTVSIGEGDHRRIVVSLK